MTEEEVQKLKKDYDGLKKEICRHIRFVNDKRFIEFRSYYSVLDPENNERIPAAKVSESPYLSSLLREATQ